MYMTYIIKNESGIANNADIRTFQEFTVKIVKELYNCISSFVFTKLSNGKLRNINLIH